jgi:hypothetical protein
MNKIVSQMLAVRDLPAFRRYVTMQASSGIIKEPFIRKSWTGSYNRKVIFIPDMSARKGQTLTASFVILICGRFYLGKSIPKVGRVLLPECAHAACIASVTANR